MRSARQEPTDGTLSLAAHDVRRSSANACEPPLKWARKWLLSLLRRCARGWAQTRPPPTLFGADRYACLFA
jgi:hypothetical protein